MELHLLAYNPPVNLLNLYSFVFIPTVDRISSNLCARGGWRSAELLWIL